MKRKAKSMLATNVRLIRLVARGRPIAGPGRDKSRCDSSLFRLLYLWNRVLLLLFFRLARAFA